MAGPPRGSGMRRPVYIVDGARTPFIKARGRPGPFTPVDLAVQRGRLLLLRQPSAAEAVDMVIFGRVNVITDEVNPARVAALPLGLGEERVAFTMQINCGSGTQSTDTAFHTVGGEFDEFQEQEEVMAIFSIGPLCFWSSDSSPPPSDLAVWRGWR